MLCFVSHSISFDMSPIMDALSKALLKEMTARVNKRIAEMRYWGCCYRTFLNEGGIGYDPSVHPLPRFLRWPG